MSKATGILFIAVVLLFALAVSPSFAAEAFTATAQPAGAMPTGQKSFRKPSTSSAKSFQEKNTSTPAKTTVEKTETGAKSFTTWSKTLADTDTQTGTTTHSTGYDYDSNGTKMWVDTQTWKRVYNNADGTQSVKWTTKSLYTKEDGTKVTAYFEKWAKKDTDGNLTAVSSKLSKTITKEDGTKTQVTSYTDYKIDKNGNAYKDKATSTYITTDKDGNQIGDKTVKLTYNYKDGKCTGATGKETIKTTDPATGNTVESTGTLTYDLKGGKLSLYKETVESTTFDKSGQKIATNSATRYRDVAKFDGEYQVTKMRTINTSTNVLTGDTQTITRVYNYERDADGKCTNINVDGSGTRTEGSQKYGMSAYSIQVTADPLEGVSIDDEDYNWEAAE